MVPNMRRVVLSCDRLGSSSYRYYKQPMMDSVCSSLCQGVDQISVDASCGGFPFALSADYLPGITRIKYCLGGGQEKTVFELIRSATTLRLLDIYRKCNGINGDEAIGLVRDEIAIPNLGQVALFPNLKVLCTSKRFYHYDDILLKGNFGTLEYLSLSLSPDLVSNLEERHTFTTNSHPRLCHLQLYNRYNPSYYASDDAATCFALKIISSAQTSLSTLELHSCFDVSAFITGVRSDTWPSRIQSLSMPEIYLNFSDMVQLLKNLPALKTLCSNIGKPKVDKHSDIADVGALGYSDKTAGEVYAAHYPLGRVFIHRFIREDAYFSDPTFSYERAVLLVALICPYFGIATLNYRDWSQEDTISEEFRQHADRLRQVKFCVDCDI
ncbi:hypothetical protein BX661DRAFT_182948 [Kickxella alabastrina]|uniref:uncharacterized protein n=1 Tax=Kickxella alabastrina TaxID=61397 RepID=UPI00221ED7F2|nr:uncharacterized protein BX661DRAFT_182948 [Kickxella alabastrina]KAI7827262.1 hypothetical protein BX661DRAFT_182948 [Kickxella alabastrina]